MKLAVAFSGYVGTTPKVQSIMKKCNDLLDLKSFTGFSPTRFLSLYQSFEIILDQFHVVSALVNLSSDETLKGMFRAKNLVINLDTVVIHVKPIYILTKVTQDPKLDVHEQLKLVLLVVSQLLARMGHILNIGPNSYFKKLYVQSNYNSDSWIPLRLNSKTTTLYHSNNEYVLSKLSNLTAEQENGIVKQWNTHNEFQLNELLKRFLPFLKCTLTRYCYVLFIPLTDFTDKKIKHLDNLSMYLHLSCSAVLDAFTAYKFSCDNQSADLRF